LDGDVREAEAAALFSKAGLVNTPWAVILPSLVSPFGFFLMWVYARDAVSDSILGVAGDRGQRYWQSGLSAGAVKE
jgi:hypothetical protein